MNNLEKVLDDTPATKAELVEQYLIPGYNFKYTKFAIPAQIQGQINAIHHALMVLHERLEGTDQNICAQAGAFLEGLETDLKNYRIEAQELNL